MKSILILLAFATSAQMQSIFRTFDWYRNLYGTFPFYVPETLKVGAGVLLCVLVAKWLYGYLDDFTLRRKARKGLVFGFVSASPMLVGFALTRSTAVSEPLAVVFLAALFPLAEEVVSRGFAFRLLWQREGWSWWMAAGLVAAITGFAHTDKSLTAWQVFGLFAYTGLGGGFTCWLLARWDSLWFPFGVHMFGNLWWEVFDVSNSALGGWFAFSLQAAMILLAIAITLRMTPNLAHCGSAVKQDASDRSASSMLLTATS